MIRIRTSKVLLLSSLWLISSDSFGQQNVSFIFVGDVMQHDGQIEAAYNKRTNSYEYEDGFKFIKPVINMYDIRVANLEVTLAGKPFKGYPQFSAPDDLAQTLVSTGFNVILTANNHSCDRGDAGVERTLDKLDELGVKHTGTFRSQEERDSLYPLMIEQNGIKVAMLNYTYGTNGLYVKKPLIVNYIDSTMIKQDIARAKELNADYIICNMHWGTEYKLLPNSYQKTYESVCYRAGADMVIGGHPHVLQPIEKKVVGEEEKLTVWSLGNFVSNMSVRYTRGGVMVGAAIEKESEKITMTDSEYWLVYVHKKQEGAIKQYYILPEFEYNTYRSDFISASEKDKMDQFFADSRKLYEEHNVGTVERKISENAELTQRYQQYLKGYYSVLVKGSDSLLVKPGIGKYLHQTVDSKGESFLLSGMWTSPEEAKGTQQFIMDCGLSENPEIVFVKPEGIEKVSE